MIATIFIPFSVPFAISLRHVVKARCSGAVCTVAGTVDSADRVKVRRSYSNIGVGRRRINSVAAYTYVVI